MAYSSPDLLDRAAALTLANLEVSLSHIKKFDGKSSQECEECGADIPKKRQEILPGITHCVDCAAVKEAKNKIYMR